MPEQNRIIWDEAISSQATENVYIDLARAMSKINRKQYTQVDAKGNAQVYLVRIQQSCSKLATTGTSEMTTTITTAPNNYVTKAAVKAWHRARVKMLTRQGMSLKQLSPYARHLRIAFDGSDSPEAELYSGVGPEDTKFVVESQLDESNTGAITADDLVDTYTLTLVGDHATSSTDPTTKYTTVGVNKSWLDARRQPMNITDANAEGASELDHLQIAHETNPLYEILSGSSIAEELSEVVEDDQLVAPPWSNGDHYAAMTQAKLYSSHNAPDSCLIEVPLGMMKLAATDEKDGGTLMWTIEVLDIYDM